MMKRLKTVLGCALALGAGFLPVRVSALSFGIGPIGGMNFANADVEDHSKTDGRQGLALGAQAEFGVTSPFSVVVEPMYVQKGAEFEVIGVTTKGEFDYVEIPLLLKAKFGAMKAHAFVFAGPSLDINVSTKGAFGSISGDFEDESESVVYSGQVGGGAAFQILPYVYLSGDVRYSMGFSDALDNSVGDIDSWKSRDIRVMLGFLFHLSQ
ncbi:MAG: porin family protein [Fibrobacteria bacterium]